MADSPIVLVSNRGPASFVVGPDGGIEPRRASGGLASGLASLGERGDCTWIAGAFGDGDRIAAAAGAIDIAGFRLRLLDPGVEVWRDYYDVISNETLWFLHHGLFDHARSPSFDDVWRSGWDAYRYVNNLFAETVAEGAPEGATVLVQDYHLSLVGAGLRRIRPDLRTVHFHHTPFCSFDELAVLPPDVAVELIDGLAGFDACGFHTRGWSQRFVDCAHSVGIEAHTTFVAPLGVDVEDLRAEAGSSACETAVGRLDELAAGRRLIVRVDRIELSKNLIRGFRSFDQLLEREPAWRGRVVFVACCYPSRQGVEAYTRYRSEVEAEVARVNERWSSGSWTPIVFEIDDDFPRSVAALRRNDVLMVNPIRDGLNLVAMEGAIVNERHGGLVLSRNAGSWAILAEAADGVHPFDISETASALDRALRRSGDERVAQARRRRELASARTPHDWLEDQLNAAD